MRVAPEQIALIPTLAERERIFAMFENDHPAFLRMYRAVAVDFARRNGTVCMDDVWTEVERLSLPTPTQIKATNRILGWLLKGCRELRPVDTRTAERKSERNIRAGRLACTILVYALAEAA
jgi:hypothetical protein